MEFGKVKDMSNLTFSLPNDRPETAFLLRGPNEAIEKNTVQNTENLPHVYIGCTGWGMKEWVGWVYPKGCKSADYLHHYSRQFNTIEMNTTHYRIPTTGDVEKWRRQSADDFRFAPKMLQTVSHSKNLGYGTGLTTQFCDAIQGLEEKLGVCFMQMPPHFQYADLAIFEKYISKFPKTIPLAIELRHEEWFSNEHYFKTLFDMLEHYRVSTVITDVAGRRDVLHQRLTTTTAVIRFVGNDLHSTDYTRIDEWVNRLKIWFELGLKEVYFFTHEPDNLKAPTLAKYLHDKIKENFAAVLRGPIFEMEKEEKVEKQFTLF
jgi:uncharacterized protein YecE (DUF72 family)